MTKTEVQSDLLQSADLISLVEFARCHFTLTLLLDDAEESRDQEYTTTYGEAIAQLHKDNPCAARAFVNDSVSQIDREQRRELRLACDALLLTMSNTGNC